MQKEKPFLGRGIVNFRQEKGAPLNSEYFRRCAPETERLSQICRERPKPQIQFAVWKGRNEHRGKEASLAAARSVVVVSDAPPAAPIFSVLPEKIGEKRGAWLRLVLPASEFR